MAVVSLWLCCFAPAFAEAGGASLAGGAQGVVVVRQLCCFASAPVLALPTRRLAPVPAAELLQFGCVCALGFLGAVPAAAGWVAWFRVLWPRVCLGTGCGLPSTPRCLLAPFQRGGLLPAFPLASGCWEPRRVGVQTHKLAAAVAALGSAFPAAGGCCAA